MSAAVLAGDQKGYLANVCQADPVFLQEQRAWARDLEKHVPVEFAFSMLTPEPEPAPPADKAPVEGGGADAGERRPPPPAAAKPIVPQFGEREARFTLRMAWKMKDAGARSVEYPVAFRLAAVEGGTERWVYAGETWERVERPADRAEPAEPGEETPGKRRFEGAIAEHAPGLEKAASLVVELMPEVRERVDALFDRHLTGVQRVKLYTSMRHLQASIYLSYTDGLGGWNEPGESIKILVSRAPAKAGLRSLLAHEYGHVATFQQGPKATDMPWWILEGVADFAAATFRDNPRAQADRQVAAWHRAGKLADWEELTDFRSVPRDKSPMVYRQGEHMVRYVTDRFGQAGRNRWMTLMAQGKTLDEATREVSGDGFDALDAAWRMSVADAVAKDDADKAEKAE